MHYILSEVAERELEQILFHLSYVNPTAAAKYASLFRSTFLFLTENPYAASVSEEDAEVLLWHIPDTQYSVPYMIRENEIQILSIFYQRRERPESWKAFKG